VLDPPKPKGERGRPLAGQNTLNCSRILLGRQNANCRKIAGRRRDGWGWASTEAIGTERGYRVRTSSTAGMKYGSGILFAFLKII